MANPAEVMASVRLCSLLPAAPSCRYPDWSCRALSTKDRLFSRKKIRKRLVRPAAVVVNWPWWWYSRNRNVQKAAYVTKWYTALTA
jgi:hypothetical protein